MKNFLSLFASILMSALIAVWFSQNPINAYWQQTYHRNSPLEPLAAYGWWRSGVARKRLRPFRRHQNLPVRRNAADGSRRRFGRYAV